jgi:hypothetical protein
MSDRRGPVAPSVLGGACPITPDSRCRTFFVLRARATVAASLFCATPITAHFS